VKRFHLLGLALLAACGSGSAQEQVDARTGPLSLDVGAEIRATTRQGISSRTDKPGGALTATVTSPVTDGAGLVVIPAGSTLHLTISVLQPAGTEGAADGKVLVLLRAVTVGGKEFAVAGEVTSLATNRSAVVAAGTPITVALRGPVTITFR